MKISPAIKGIITAALMIGMILLIFNIGKDADARLQYAVYAIYALGIVWTLVTFRHIQEVLEIFSIRDSDALLLLH